MKTGHSRYLIYPNNSAEQTTALGPQAYCLGEYAEKQVLKQSVEDRERFREFKELLIF